MHGSDEQSSCSQEQRLIQDPPLSNSGLEKFTQLITWRQGGRRAPHKPLLVLFALGEWQRGNRSLSYAEHEDKLKALIQRFGTYSKAVHPEYPFWRLQNDGVWIVEANRSLRSRQSNAGDIPRSELRSAQAQGRFSEDVSRALECDPKALTELAKRLLVDHFPDSLHTDLLNEVGLDLHVESASRRRRDPGFRDRVLAAYRHRCAVCGLDMKLGNLSIGLEAAHIRWHQASGPNTVDNGLALCSLHHKVFDLGAFTVSRSLQLLVSDQVHGSTQLEEALLKHHGKSIQLTPNPTHRPHTAYLEWHRREVFKGETLYLDPGT